MARPKSLFPNYRKHRASGQAVCTINGIDHYLGPHGTKASKLEYDRLIMEWVASGRSSGYGKPAGCWSVSSLVLEYLDHAKKYYGTGSTSEYQRFRYVVRPLVDLYGETPATEFGPGEFRAVRQHFIDKMGLTRSSINHQMKRLVRVFRWGASEGKIPATVPQTLALIPGLRKGKTEAKEAPPVLPADDAVVDATLKVLPEVVADMVRLQRFTGMRPGEICILRPCDVDRSGDVWIYRPSSHKTQHHGHSRQVFIGPQGQDVLLRYLARDSEAFCFRPCDSEAKRLAARHAGRKVPMSCGNKPGSNRTGKPRKKPGDRYVPDAYAAAVRRALKTAFPQPEELEGDELAAWKLKYRWSPNKLRHAAATQIRREFGLEAAQVALGHATANITQVYAERDFALGIEVAAKIG